PLLSITSDPLIDRRSANSIAAAKLAFAVIAAQPITHQLNPLVHGTGFLPRHRQPPPCRRNVNHVPGLFCKRCYRFVPTPALSQRERELKSTSTNAWDVASAKIFSGLAFPAIATTSSGIANCLGYYMLSMYQALNSFRAVLMI